MHILWCTQLKKLTVRVLQSVHESLEREDGLKLKVNIGIKEWAKNFNPGHEDLAVQWSLCNEKKNLILTSLPKVAAKQSKLSR